jgi:hypothetical protein
MNRNPPYSCNLSPTGTNAAPEFWPGQWRYKVRKFVVFAGYIATHPFRLHFTTTLLGMRTIQRRYKSLLTQVPVSINVKKPVLQPRTRQSPPWPLAKAYPYAGEHRPGSALEPRGHTGGKCRIVGSLRSDMKGRLFMKIVEEVAKSHGRLGWASSGVPVVTQPETPAAIKVHSSSSTRGAGPADSH